MGTYRLSRKAEEDILAIFAIGVREFGLDQAERYHADLEAAFHFLSAYPRAARERTEIDPPVRAYPRGSHLIVYEIDGNDIFIVRLRHQSEDWMNSPMEKRD